MSMSSERDTSSKWKKVQVLMLSMAFSMLIVILSISNAEAVLLSTLVDEADNNHNNYPNISLEPSDSWIMHLNPSSIDWIAFHDAPELTGGLVGGGYAWIGLVDDYFNLTITNLDTSATITRTMDYNGAWGHEGGWAQSIVFGTAAAAPDTMRQQNPYWTNPYGSSGYAPYWQTYNQAGLFNDFINSEADYEFSIMYGNTGSWTMSHTDMYMLVEGLEGASSIVESGAPVPEPATMLLLGSGLVGLVGFRRKLK